MTVFLILAAVSAFVTAGAAWLLKNLGMRYHLYPRIRERDVHTEPTPRLGGVAMFLGVGFGLAAAWLIATLGPGRYSIISIVFTDPIQVFAILGACFIVVAVGVADDLWDLDWLTKLAGQIVAAALVAWKGVAIVSLPLGSILLGSAWMSAVLTVIVIVIAMNAVNFIDGLDGLVAGVAFIASGVFFLYTYMLVQRTSPFNYFNLAGVLAVIVVGITFGFLFFNWHPAKLFMGDSGSMLVGLLMSVSAIAVTGQVDPVSLELGEFFPAFIPIILPLSLLLIPLLDFILAILRRVSAGDSPYKADRKHLHHRLLELGHSHVGTVLVFYAWTAAISFGCLLTFVFPVYFGLPSAWAFLILGVMLLACLALTLAPLTASWRRRQARAEVGEAGSSPSLQVAPVVSPQPPAGVPSTTGLPGPSTTGPPGPSTTTLPGDQRETTAVRHETSGDWHQSAPVGAGGPGPSGVAKEPPSAPTSRRSLHRKVRQ